MKNKGFTLIELIVVMAIIAILVLLAAPRFLGYTKDANVTVMKQDIKVLSDAAELYHINTGDWPKSEKIDSHGIGGVDELYKLNESALGDSIKNIKGDYGEYGIAIDGKHVGQVFHLTGVEGKDGYKEYGNQLVGNQLVIFDGKKYNNINEIPESPADWFKHDAEEDNEFVTIFGFADGVNETKINIPSEINGKTVTRLADSSGTFTPLFKSVEEVILPRDTRVIGSSAFIYGNLKSIVIPDTVEHIRERAFENNNIESVDIPPSVKYIDNWAFASNNISNLTLHNKYIRFQAGVFNKNQLSDDQAFVYYRELDGTIDKTTLVSYGGANKNNVKIPDSVNEIARYAMVNVGVESVIIPSGVKKINSPVFVTNPLKKVVFEGSVDTIAKHTFARKYNWDNISLSSPSIEDTQSNGPWSGTWTVENNTDKWTRQ